MNTGKYFDDDILAALRSRFAEFGITAAIKRNNETFLLVLKRQNVLRLAYKGDSNTTADQLLEVASSFVTFADTDMAEGVKTPEAVERFLALPGRVEILSEDRMVFRVHR